MGYCFQHGVIKGKYFRSKENFGNYWRALQKCYCNLTKERNYLFYACITKRNGIAEVIKGDLRQEENFELEMEWKNSKLTSAYQLLLIVGG